MCRLSKILLLLVIIQVVTGCGYFIGKTVTVEIPDLSEKWKKEIKVDLPDEKYVNKLKIRVQGNSTRNFKLDEKEVKSGKIDTVIYNSDHYSKSYHLHYEPMGEDNNGYVKVNLTFYY